MLLLLVETPRDEKRLIHDHDHWSSLDRQGKKPTGIAYKAPFLEGEGSSKNR
jgi:hypothetical protein